MTTVVVTDTPHYQVEITENGTRTVLLVDVPAYQLTVATEGVQGPAGAQGPPGPPGQSGAAAEQLFAFAAPALVWEAEHTLPLARPGVWALDGAGVVIEGDVTFPTPTRVRVEWAWPMAGTLVLTT